MNHSLSMLRKLHMQSYAYTTSSENGDILQDVQEMERVKAIQEELM